MAKVYPLPYIPRPETEVQIAAFLHNCLSKKAHAPKVLILTGEQGIGKHRLIQEVLEQDPAFKAFKPILDIRALSKV